MIAALRSTRDEQNPAYRLIRYFSLYLMGFPSFFRKFVKNSPTTKREKPFLLT
jgi:hypothetical protein